MSQHPQDRREHPLDGRAKPAAPLPNARVADDQAALGEQVLNIAQAEVQADVQPDRVGDHLFIAGDRSRWRLQYAGLLLPPRYQHLIFPLR